VLQEFFSESHGIADTHIENRYKTVNRTFMQLNHHIKRLAELWRVCIIGWRRGRMGWEGWREG
jgi:hypothetical protein